MAGIVYNRKKDLIDTLKDMFGIFLDLPLAVSDCLFFLFHSRRVPEELRVLLKFFTIFLTFQQD